MYMIPRDDTHLRKYVMPLSMSKHKEDTGLTGIFTDRWTDIRTEFFKYTPLIIVRG